VAEEEEQAALARLRSEAENLFGDLDERSAKLLAFAEEKMRELGCHCHEARSRLEEKLRGERRHSQALLEERAQMVKQLASLKERLQAVEAGSIPMDISADAPPSPALGPSNVAAPGPPPGLPPFPLPSLAEAIGPPAFWEPPAGAISSAALAAASGWALGPKDGVPSSPSMSPVPCAPPPGLPIPGEDAPGRKLSGSTATWALSSPNPRTLRSNSDGGTPHTPRHLLTPQRWSLDSATPMKSPAIPASPYVQCESGGCVFGFTLRLADGVALGLELDPASDGSGLEVMAVVADSAIASWNKQCRAGPKASKEVRVGDKLVAVNNTTEAAVMELECRTKTMLKLTLVRGEPDCEIPIGWAGQAEKAVKIQTISGALSQHALQNSLSQAPPVDQAAFAKMLSFTAPTAEVQAPLSNAAPQWLQLPPPLLSATMDDAQATASSQLRLSAAEFVPMTS